MTKNTTEDGASSPPAFMLQNSDVPASLVGEEAAEEVAEKPFKLPPDDKDAMEKRSATVVKCTTRLEEQADYLGRIDDVVKLIMADFIGRHPMGETIDKFLLLEAQIYAAEEKVKSLKAKCAFAREVLFPGRMDAEESRTATSAETGNRMSRTSKMYASIIPDATEGAEPQGKAFKWLRDNNLGSLIKETVNASTLSATAKELVENGRELPDDLFKVHTKDSVSITKGKPKVKKG